MAQGRVISAVLTLKDRNFSSGVKQASSATKDMERKVKHTGNSIRSFGKSATSSFKRVGETAAGMVGAIGITKAVSAGFNMIKSSVGGAMGRLDTMEQFANVMEVMTGSTETANKALEETREIVKGTAFGLDVAAGAVQGFVTGGMKVEDATRIMGSFTDAVAFYTKGTNEDLSSVTDAMTKMTTKGKVDMEQLGRIIEAGIPAIDIYAEATNQSTEEVADAISKGNIQASEFMDVMDEAFANGTTKFPALAGAAKNAGASWAGTFDNMRAAVTRGVGTIIEKIDEALKSNGIPDMRSMVSEFGSTFESVLGKAADMVPGVTAKLVGLYEQSKPGLAWLKDTAFPAVKSAVEGFYGAAKTAFGWIKDNLPLVTAAVAGLAGGLAAFKIMSGINTAFGIYKTLMMAVRTQTLLQTAAQLGLNTALLASPLTWVAVAIGAVIAIGVLLWKNWDKVSATAKTLWAVVKKTFSEMKTNVVNWFGEMKDGAVEKFNDIVKSAKELPGKIGQGIKDFASDAWDGIKELATGLLDKFKSVLGIKSPSKEFFNMAKWIVKGLVNGLSAENLKSLGTSVFKDFAGGAFKTITSIKDFLSGAFSGNASDTIGLSGRALAQQLANKHGLRITSGFRPGAITAAGTPSDHGRGMAYDLGGSWEGMWQAALEAQKNPAVKYVINRNLWSRNGGPWQPYPWGGHMDHTHISLKDGYWTGGRVTSSNRYLVGERGPEVVDLPAGSRVHNAQDSKRMGGEGNTFHININAVDKSVNEIVSELVPALKTRLANI